MIGLIMRGVVLAAGVALASHAVAKPMTFHTAYSGGNCGRGHCSWIAADGEITDATNAQLRSFLKAEQIQPDSQWILINSPGGDLLGGLDLGETIRTLKMNVRVGATKTYEAEGPGGAPKSYGFEGGICASACVFAFMGGLERELADEDSRVGVHQFAPVLDRTASERTTTSTAQTVVAVLHDYTARMGISGELIGIASATTANDIQWLPLEVLEATNLITSRRKPSEADWELKPLGSRLAGVVTQEQESGRKATFALTCDALHVYLPVVATRERKAEIAAGIGGGSMRTGGPFGSSSSLRLISALSRDEGILLMFRVGHSYSSVIGRSSAPLELNIDVGQVYWNELDGPTYQIPRSNLAKLSPHIDRSCR